MKLTFLGTAAAEGVPAMFCDCKTCQKARVIKGKDIRRRSSLLINNDLIIDMGPDLFNSCMQFNININKLKYGLVTHCHFDHFYPENLEIRSERYQYRNFPTLNLLGNSSVFYKLSQLGYKDSELYVHRVEAELYEKYIFGEYTIVPIPANHAHEFGMALNYIVTYGNKTILYATDTGIYKDEWFHNISHYKLDCVILDGTNVFTSTSTNHLNFDGIKLMKNKLIDNTNINNDSLIICTHFSHEGLMTHKKMQEKLELENIKVAYDGMVMDL